MSIRIVSDTPINQFILPILVPIDNLSQDLFFTINETICVSMMVEVDFPPPLINRDHLLPVVGLYR